MFGTAGVAGLRDRRVRLLAIGGALGVLLILIGNALLPPPPAADPGPVAGPGPAATRARGPLPEGMAAVEPDGILAASEQALAERVATLLSRVAGAGRVAVMVRLAAGEEVIYLQDDQETDRETSERDTQGGTRTIEERTRSVQTVFTQDGRGGSRPVRRTVRGPRIEGVVVVAEGAGDAGVRWRLARAVRAIFPGLPPHRIEILEGRGG